MIINLYHGWVYAPLLYRFRLFVEAHYPRGLNSGGVFQMSAISEFSSEPPTSGTLDPERSQPARTLRVRIFRKPQNLVSFPRVRQETRVSLDRFRMVGLCSIMAELSGHITTRNNRQDS